MVLQLKGIIHNIRHETLVRKSNPKRYTFESFDINRAASYGTIEYESIYTRKLSASSAFECRSTYQSGLAYPDKESKSIMVIMKTCCIGRAAMFLSFLTRLIGARRIQGCMANAVNFTPHLTMSVLRTICADVLTNGSLHTMIRPSSAICLALHTLSSGRFSMA